MHKYVIMGIQGSGKGTQADLLKEKLDLVHISVGDIFRWNIQNHTKLGARIKRTVDSGHLVSDEMVWEVMRDRLEQHDWNYGFVLDGFPRNASQARYLLESYNINAVILIEVPDEVVFERMLSRRLCSGCGLDYNLIQHRPATADECDVCGGTLIARPDDNPEAIRDRLREYHASTQPIVELFEHKELVVKVDGTKAPDAVQAEISSKLRLEDGSLEETSS